MSPKPQPPKAKAAATTTTHQALEISERHRRYESNREYEALLTGAGL